MVRPLLPLAVLSLSLCLTVGCDSGPKEPPLPEGTEVNGTLENGDILNVAYVPAGEEGEPILIPVIDDHTKFYYRSAVPPGDYAVYAYITGARAKVQDVTVADETVTIDIPESLDWEEVDPTSVDGP